MEHISLKIPEAALTLKNTNENVKLANREAPRWFPTELQNEYNKTDLIYDPYCLKLFAQLEAAKREKFPPETMRQWFVEFIRRGWTANMVMERYKALLSIKIYGVEKLDFADWVNAIQTYALDEVQLMVKSQINMLEQKGKYLRSRLKQIEENGYQLSESDKTALDLSLTREMEFTLKTRILDAVDEYKENKKVEFSNTTPNNPGISGRLPVTLAEDPEE